jgi:hypothetical protein
MKKVIVLTLLVAFFAASVNAAVASDNKEIVGTWKWENPTAGYGYDKGTLAISAKEGKLVGQVIYEDGFKIEMKKMSYTEGVLKFGIYVDYEYIGVKAKVDGKKMAGTVDSPEGETKFTATKIK